MVTKASRLLVITLIALLVPVTLVAQQQTNEESADLRQTGNLTGRVVSESGQPLPNATIFVRTIDGLQTRTTSTSTDGSFNVSGLDPTLYFVSASMPGFVPRRMPEGPFSYYRPGDSVKLNLIKGGVITGTVTTTNGEPVIGVRVRAYMIRDEEGRSTKFSGFAREKPTDDRGIYRIYGLGAGTYVVAAAGVGFSAQGGAYDSDAPTFAPSSTIDTASEFTVRPGEETTNVDIKHRFEAGHEVSGTTSGSTSTGPYMQPTLINLMPVSSGLQVVASTSFQMPGSRGFSFSGVPDGTYDVAAQASGSSGILASDPVRIVVKGADVTGIELTTKPLGSVSGRLIFEPSKEPECKDKRSPVLSQTVIIPLRNEEKTQSSDLPPITRGFAGPTVPDSKGSFTFRNLSANRYGFDVRLFVRYWYLKSITLSAPAAPTSAEKGATSRVMDVARNWLNVKPGDRVSGLNITVAGGGASFRGALDVEPNEKVTPNLFLHLVPAEREKSNDSLRFFATSINENGSFTLNNLPGRYWLLIRSVTADQSKWPNRLRLPEEAETRARLRRNAEALKTEVELKPCQTMEGYKLPRKALPAAP